MTTDSEIEPLPSPEEFAFLRPLYRWQDATDEDFVRALKTYRSFKFDMYCVTCEREATFSVLSKVSGYIDTDAVFKPAYTTLLATCTRSSHAYRSDMLFTKTKVLKFGQYPSLEDIQGADIRKYKSVLRDGYFGELSRATGLASHGIGIGSFVYLRRIFEKLISDHYAIHVAESGEIEGFETMWMEEKIGALKDVLPSALVENRAAYGILSKGLHELSEDECKLYFPVVRAAIINILEQDFQARERERTAKEVRDQVAAIAGKLRRPDSEEAG